MAKVPKRSTDPEMNQTASKEDKPYRKIGEGTLAATARLGLDEARNGLYSDSNIAAKHAPYGMWGTPTPQEVTESHRPSDDTVHGRADQEGDKADERADDEGKNDVFSRDTILGTKMREARDRAGDHDKGDRDHEIELNMEE